MCGLFGALYNGFKAAGSEYFLKMSDKKDFLEQQLTKYLKDHMDQSSPELFVESFEKNENITDFIPQEDIDFIKKLAKDDKNVPLIKQNIMRNLASFNKEWVLDWLFNNAPQYYQVIATHERRADFEDWMAAQITNIGKFIAGFDLSA